MADFLEAAIRRDGETRLRPFFWINNECSAGKVVEVRKAKDYLFIKDGVETSWFPAYL